MSTPTHIDENTRVESDSLGKIEIAADRLWGAQTQRSLHYFSIGTELMPREMVQAYAWLKKACAEANRRAGRLDGRQAALIAHVCDEILAGQHQDMFPLHVWMTGSGTQFNMNVNEVIANRCCQLAGTPLGSKTPVDPNDDVNMSQSTNDNFPSAMHVAAGVGVTRRLIPAVAALRDAIAAKATLWADIIRIGRTHLQDATPLTLGQQWSGYAAMLDGNLAELDQALIDVWPLTLGGTAVGTGLNAPADFAQTAVTEIARLTDLPFQMVANRFAAQGGHNGLVRLSGALRTLAVTLTKIANDIRLVASGPRAGLGELILPENEPGSSMMPGKVNPTQCEALTMVAAQVMANDVAVGLGGAGGQLEMNVYKPLIIYNLCQSITLLADGSTNFRRFLIEGAEPHRRNIAQHLDRSLMLVTALAPVIGYAKAAEIAHHASVHDLTLREAALELGHVSAADFDRIVDPRRMIGPDGG